MRFRAFTTLAAVVTGASAASAVAPSYALTLTRFDAGLRDAIELRVVDLSPEITGGKFQAMKFDATVTPKAGSSSAAAYFRVVDTNNNSVPDKVDLFNAGNDAAFSFARATPVAATSTYVDQLVVPTNAFAEPNPWLPGVSSFSVAHTANDAASSVSSTILGGVLVARFVVDDGAGLSISGQWAGTVGPVGNASGSIAATPEPAALTALCIPAAAVLRRRRFS